MDPSEGGKRERSQRLAGYLGVICSFLYLALFFPSFYVAILAPNLFENAHMTASIGIIVVFLSVSVPLSIVVSIGLIWFMYFRGAYKNVYFFCLFPLIVATIVVVCVSLLQHLFL